MKANPQRVFDKLVQAALFRGQGRQYERFLGQVEAGKVDPEDMPEKLRPGWLVKRLSTQERKALTKLTSSMTYVQDQWVF